MTIPNTKLRKFLDNFDLLVELCVVDPDRKEKWNEAIQLWVAYIAWAGQREDFSDDEINELEELGDEFFRIWLDLHGQAGVTNYIHLIGAGHLSYYLIMYVSVTFASFIFMSQRQVR
jgi:hypothetical protein